MNATTNDFDPSWSLGGVVIEAEPAFESLERAVQTTLVFVLCLTTIIGNSLTIATMICIPSKRQVIDLYVLSLSIADLLVALVVIPFALASQSEIFGVQYLFCSISGYLHVSLCAVCMYTYMWMAVDRYLAVRKGLRYDTIQTKTRCKCWVLFTWVMSTFLCCPPLLGNSKGHFYDEGFMCLLHVQSMLPYTVTLASLVLIPSVLTMCYTYGYIFSTSPTGTKEDCERNHSDHLTTFLVTVVFVVSWMPWGILELLEYISNSTLLEPGKRFWLLWIGELQAAWTPLVLLLTCRRCRIGLRNMCTFCVKVDTTVAV